MYEAQYKYQKENKEKYLKYARESYHRIKNDPVRSANRKKVRTIWYQENKDLVLKKQRDKKRERKAEAIKYLGGFCSSCKETFHPAVFEFHHRNPEEKDKDPSKLLSLKWERVKEELDKCDLLCANCHRLVHHNWECKSV